MKLTVLERLLLLRLLPRQGNLTTLRIVRDMERELGFSEEEHAALQFVNSDDGSMSWDREADEEKDVEFGDVAYGLVRKGLSQLDKAEGLQMGHLTLCDKFGYEESDDAAE